MSGFGGWEAAARTLRRSGPFRQLAKDLGEATRLPTPAAAWIAELLAAELGRPLLVVVPHEGDTYAWSEAARLFTGHDAVASFPAPALTPYQEAEVSLPVRAEESLAVDRALSGGARTLLATPRALFRRLPPPGVFRPAVLQVREASEWPQASLVEHLLRWGYRRADLVMEPGQFAIRGGVFDLFPPGEPTPIRLDLFGDTVESIQRFEPESQRSAERLDAARIRPLSLFPRGAEEARRLALRLAEGPLPEDGLAKVDALRERGGFDGWEHYLPLLADGTIAVWELLEEPLVVTLDRQSLLQEAAEHRRALEADFEARRSTRRLAAPPEVLEQPFERVEAFLENADVNVGDLLVADQGAADFGASWTEAFHEQLPRFPREVATVAARGEQAVLVASRGHREQLTELLEGREVPIGPGGLQLIEGELQRGFRLPGAGITVFGERQLLRRSPILRRRKARYGPFLSSLRDLKVGDYVVHVDHGIAQFVGLRNLGATPSSVEELPPELRGSADAARASETEVMELLYSGGRRLLLPLTRLDLVQKYGGIEGVAPRLDKLGGTSWSRTKQRIKRELRDMAQELLRLYAERQLAEAPALPEDSDLQRQFEIAFEYEETPDQLEAVAAIKADLESRRPMDRLLCGDVGFGKTEVAMRAAFKAVDGGYQVAVLAPTTILADQHLETFRRRFAGFPVLIDMISRFRSDAEARQIQRRAEEGKIDVLIGTHRLLARGVRLPKLGLLIVDEEQRFGVAHKERLKQLRRDVHVLAMSATPVPRTLQLSLAGVRDLSVIESPPRDRMAVETAIVPFDAQLIREAIEYERERGGQIYFVHNRVESIERMAAYLREVVAGLRLTVGHGQLDEAELARRMHAFVAGEYELLLATTIIENGIDIPNVNTMLVHRADRFGLAQLYQLRGRVGRSDQLAFCYLLIPRDRVLSQEARKRLEAIREFSELGAGFRVAGRDLEIRGAGNLLGAEQSGHIASVGIETYLKLLEEAVAERKGEEPAETPSVTLDLPVSASIPQEYIGDPNLRMEIYRRVATSDDARDEVLAELRDRFGPPPDGVRALLELSELKRRAESLRLQAISARQGRLTFRLRHDTTVEPERLIAFVADRPRARFSPSGVLTLDGVPTASVLSTAREVLDRLGV